MYIPLLKCNHQSISYRNVTHFIIFFNKKKNLYFIKTDFEEVFILLIL